MALIALILSAATLVHAQGASEAEHVRALNNSILRLYGQAQEANASQRASLRSQAAAVLQERFTALQTLIAQDPSEALQLAFDPNLLRLLAMAFPQSAGNLESHGVWEGPIEYVILDDPTLGNHRVDIRMKVDQEVLDIHFRDYEPEGLKCGDILRVEGMKAGEQVAAADGSVTGAVAGAGCVTTGDQKVVVILVEFPDDPLVAGDQSVHLPSTVTPTMVNNIFFAATGRSVDGFWRESSYGKASASGVVVGPVTLDRKYTCDEYSAMRQAAINAADGLVNFTGYTRLMIVFPNPGSCAWAGLGTLGCSSLSSPGDGSFTASSSWLLANYMGSIDNGVKLSTHEGGHNLTLHHASSRAFTNSTTGLPETLGLLGTAGTISEYGDLFNTMGSWNFGQYNAPHKVRLGWLTLGTTSGSKALQIESNGSFSIQPFENLPGLAALKVRRGTGNNAWLWLEYRQPIGLYDSAINSQVYGGALVHYEDSTTGTRTHLLDMTPGSSGKFNDPAKLPGNFTDTYTNVSFNVDSVSSSALNVTVNYGPVSCYRANPAISITPSSLSGQSGAALKYTVTITNNDSSGCTTDFSFNLSSTLPLGWTTAFASSTLNIAPGTSAATDMTKTIPGSAAPSSNQVNATATRGTNSATATATANVIVAPVTTVATDRSSYVERSKVTMTATVTVGGAAAPGASVLFTMTKKENGSTTTKIVAANSSGVATWSYKLNPKNPSGTYTVKARATYNSLTGADSAEVSFTVQ